MEAYCHLSGADYHEGNTSVNKDDTCQKHTQLSETVVLLQNGAWKRKETYTNELLGCPRAPCKNAVLVTALQGRKECSDLTDEENAACKG